jgi:hypothetical protein
MSSVAGVDLGGTKIQAVVMRSEEIVGPRALPRRRPAR